MDKVFVKYNETKYEVEISSFDKFKPMITVSNIWNTVTGENVTDYWFSENIIDKFENVIIEDLQKNQIDDFLNNFLE